MASGVDYERIKAVWVSLLVEWLVFCSALLCFACKGLGIAALQTQAILEAWMNRGRSGSDELSRSSADGRIGGQGVVMSRPG